MSSIFCRSTNALKEMLTKNKKDFFSTKKETIISLQVFLEMNKITIAVGNTKAKALSGVSKHNEDQRRETMV